MSLRLKFSEQFKPVRQVIGIILIPIILDLGNYMVFEKIFRTTYQPGGSVVTLKLGFISAPPSIRFILEDFPTPLFQSANGGMQGIVNQLTLFNVLLLISFTMIFSFLHSGYLGVLSEAGRRPLGFKAFFSLGNRFWFKFFVLQILGFLPLYLMLCNPGLIYFSLISLIFVYVKYSIVVDEGTLLDNFKRGVGFFGQNIRLTIKMAICFGLIITLPGILVQLLASQGKSGIIIAIVLVAYLGAAINKTVLEVYREQSQEKPAIPEQENESIGNLDVYA